MPPLARDTRRTAARAQGGDLGWTNPGLFVPEFEEVMNALGTGRDQRPVVSRFGVHLIQLLERRQADMSQREQREMVRSMLREKKLDEAYPNWAQEVRARAYVELREPPLGPDPHACRCGTACPPAAHEAHRRASASASTF